MSHLVTIQTQIRDQDPGGTRAAAEEPPGGSRSGEDEPAGRPDESGLGPRGAAVAAERGPAEVRTRPGVRCGRSRRPAGFPWRCGRPFAYVRPGWPRRLRTLGVSVLFLFVLGSLLSAWFWLLTPAAQRGSPDGLNAAVVYGGRPLGGLCLGIWGWLLLLTWVGGFASTKTHPVGQALDIESPS